MQLKNVHTVRQLFVQQQVLVKILAHNTTAYLHFLLASAGFAVSSCS